MAQDNFIQDEILNLFNQQQQTQTQPVFNSGLLSGDQQNFGDVLANPDQAQVNAGIAGVASLLSGRDAGTALINSANAFGKTRQQTYTNQLAANKVERESLRDRLSSAISVGNFGISQEKLNREALQLSDTTEGIGGIIGTNVQGKRVFKANPVITSDEEKALYNRERDILTDKIAAKDTLFQRADTLRDEVTSRSADFVIIGNSYARIKAVANNPSPAGDLALIFNFMKMLDPNSVVRESEFATAQNTASVPDSIRNAYNRVLNGQKLGETRNDFLNQSEALYESQKLRNEIAVNSIVSVGEQFGVKRSEILGVPATVPATEKYTIKEIGGQ